MQARSTQPFQEIQTGQRKGSEKYYLNGHRQKNLLWSNTLRITWKLLDGKNDRETYLTLAQIYEKGKNFGEMAKVIDAAEKLSMTTDEKEAIYFMRGAMYEKQKKVEASEAEFRKVEEWAKKNGVDLRKDPLVAPIYYKYHPEEKPGAGKAK